MKILALSGGVGGAKLVLGLSRVVPPEELTVVVNTGDDEEFHGLHVSPDVDTVMYTLAGLVNPETGWGVGSETFHALERLEAFGAETWFRLGDKDLATHIRRTQLLKEGRTLSEVTRELCRRLGIPQRVVPATDDRLRTMVRTDEGELAFQSYFVGRRCEPRLEGLSFDGAETASPAPGFDDALRRAHALVFGPSNPWLSVEPILAIRGVRDAVKTFRGKRIAVSPIVEGRALKGPAAKIMGELGYDVSVLGIAHYYRELCDLLVIDRRDAESIPAILDLGLEVRTLDTIMNTLADKVALAEAICRLVPSEDVNQ